MLLTRYRAQANMLVDIDNSFDSNSIKDTVKNAFQLNVSMIH
jgi:hypothetical protein